MAGASTT